MNTPISAIILALGIALSGYFVKSGIVTFKTLNRVVDVRGLDEKIVDSNEATWTVAFVTQANQLTDVYKKSSETEKTIRQYLSKMGFSDNEITTGVLNTVDLYQNNYSQNKPAFKYSGRLSLTVASKNVDQIEKAQNLSSELVAKEIQIEENHIRYFYTGLNTIKPEMLKNANQSAREAAMSFAKDTGSSVGKIANASQGLFTIESPIGFEQESSRKKKIRVVTQVSYYLD